MGAVNGHDKIRIRCAELYGQICGFFMTEKGDFQMAIDRELWELFPIQVTEYKEHWKDWYREERAFLSSFLPKGVRIYHIGSTAIEGIWAKPIVDILVEASIGEHEAIKELLLKNDYLCMAQSKNRMDFNKGYTPKGFAKQVFHLHLRKRL